VKTGLDSFQNQFPDSNWPRNVACWMACRAGNTELARKMFAEIGVNCDEELWGGLDVYLEHRDSVQELQPNRLSRRIVAHSRRAYSMALSANGNLIATCGKDPEICVFEAGSGKLQKAAHLSVEAWENVAFRSETELVGKKNKEIVRWNISDGGYREVKWETPNEGSTFGLSPDGSTAVVAPDNGEVRLYTYFAETGKLRSKIPSASGPIKSYFPILAFSPDGKRLYHSNLQKTVTIFDLVNGNIQKSIDLDTKRMSCLAPFQNGKRIAVVMRNRNAEVDVHSGKIVWSQDTPEEGGEKLIVSDDGRWWVMGMEYPGGGRVMIWDRKVNDGWHGMPEIRSPTDMAFSRDGKTLLTLSGSGFLRFWKLED
jgi:WD40 repeat protein